MELTTAVFSSASTLVPIPESPDPAEPFHLPTGSGSKRCARNARYRWRTAFTGLKPSTKTFIVPSVMKYRFREPLLAILKGPVSSVGFLTIKRGSVITVKGDEQACGFVEVDYEGQIVLAFMRGIQLRADRVRWQAI